MSSPNVQNEISYEKAIKKYFKLKKRYGKTYLSETKKKKFKCAGCKRPFQTVFDFQEGAYIAQCGNLNDPCPLMIRIERAKHIDVSEKIRSLSRELEEIKQSIIQLKERFIHRFIPETEMNETFKSIKGQFSAVDKEVTKMKDLHKNVMDNEDIKETRDNFSDGLEGYISEIKEHIRQFHVDKDAVRIRDAVEVYTDNVVNSIDNMRNVQFKEVNYVQSPYTDDYQFYIQRILHNEETMIYQETPGRVLSFVLK